jgi:GTP:adenosylcobinamide-phosphate guanylyltransferase
MADELAAVVMAAGIGTRMKSATPKHLHPILGRRMVDWVVDAARGAGVERLVVVASPQTSDLLEDVEVAVQEEPLGTGDAVRQARAALEGFGGDVLVLNGDVPALRPETIQALVETHRGAGAAATILSFEPADAGAYGRIVRDSDGKLSKVTFEGKEVDLLSFRHLYISVLSVYMRGEYGEVENTPTQEMKINIKSSSKNQEIIFYRVTTSKAYYTVNGEGKYYVLVDSINKIQRNVGLLISGKEVPSK